jgi:glycosyltransferase involved in cell wall biosynthesis
MKIHCIALTKNEEDVVGYCLTEASKWADYIYVYDGGSTDATWEIVKSLKSSSSIPCTIIPWKQDGKVFREGLRAEVFNEFRHLSVDGDWWLQLNVDEFYNNLRDTLSRIPAATDFVWGIPIEYYITWKDLNELDFSLPIEKLLRSLRYYRADWSEPRCFRYRRRLIWHSDWAWPRHPGLVAKERIIFKHYPCRSPKQIQTRLDVRRANRQKGFSGWEHASQASWKEKIVNISECNIDDGSGYYLLNDRLPRHIEQGPRRIIKRVMHQLGIWP